MSKAVRGPPRGARSLPGSGANQEGYNARQMVDRPPWTVSRAPGEKLGREPLSSVVPCPFRLVGANAVPLDVRRAISAWIMKKKPGIESAPNKSTETRRNAPRFLYILKRL